MSHFKLDRQGFGTLLFEPAYLLVDEIQLQPVRSASLRRPVFNRDAHSLAGRHWMGQQGLAVKFGHQQTILIEHANCGHDDTGPHGLARQPECIAAILN